MCLSSKSIRGRLAFRYSLRVGDTGTIQTDFRRACVTARLGDMCHMTLHTLVGGVGWSSDNRPVRQTTL